MTYPSDIQVISKWYQNDNYDYDVILMSKWLCSSNIKLIAIILMQL
jgi:hypothetical protein